MLGCEIVPVGGDGTSSKSDLMVSGTPDMM